MTLRPHLLDELRRSHGGQPWHGPATRDALDGVTAADAAATPIAGAHSIWQLVLHMTAWTREVTRRADGGEPGMPEMGDWPAVGRPTAARWDAAQADLAAAHAGLLAVLERLPAARLRERVGTADDPPLGTGPTMAIMLAGIAEHDAYHTGQIVLLKKALAAR